MEQKIDSNGTIQTEVLGLKAVSKLLGVGVSTLYDMARQRKIPHRRIGAGRGRIMFTTSDIQEILEKSKVEAD